jgi:hypothetical protein
MALRIAVVLAILSGPFPAAQSLPSPPDILKAVGESYAKAQRYLVHASGTIESPAFPGGPRSLEFTIAIELPDRMRLEGDLSAFAAQAFFKGPVAFVHDGEFAWI